MKTLLYLLSWQHLVSVLCEDVQLLLLSYNLQSVHHPSPGQNRQYKPFRLVSVPLSCGQKQSISVTDRAPMFRGRCKYNYFIIIIVMIYVSHLTFKEFD